MRRKIRAREDFIRSMRFFRDVSRPRPFMTAAILAGGFTADIDAYFGNSKIEGNAYFRDANYGMAAIIEEKTDTINGQIISQSSFRDLSAAANRLDRPAFIIIHSMKEWEIKDIVGTLPNMNTKEYEIKREEALGDVYDHLSSDKIWYKAYPLNGRGDYVMDRSGIESGKKFDINGLANLYGETIAWCKEYGSQYHGDSEMKFYGNLPNSMKGR